MRSRWWMWLGVVARVHFHLPNADGAAQQVAEDGYKPHRRDAAALVRGDIKVREEPAGQ